MEYQASKIISLKSSSQYNEKWLQAKIIEDTTLLGLGELEVRDVERRQHKAGRLDLLLADTETNTRYEVEIQLGSTDESHIIRTIEYWDIERRRYPMYDHVAVIVAEDITSRFLNVVGLFNGFIPLIAIQLRAIQVGDSLTLTSTTVLDRSTMVDFEDEDAVQVGSFDRSYWEKRGSIATVNVVDDFLEIIKEVTSDRNLHLKFNKHYIGLAREGIADNFIAFKPRKQHLQIEFRIPRSDELTARVEDSGLESLSYDKFFNYFRVKINEGDLAKHRAVLKELIGMATDIAPESLGDWMSDILIRQIGEKWRKPNDSGYTNEAQLQKLLQEYPELISRFASQCESFHWIPNGKGPSDVVAIDAFNGLTLVECKLASNPEVRREIIGQVLDYASKFWHLSIEEFESQWLARTGIHPSNYPDWEVIRDRLEGNLSTGEFRIILAVDKINSDLRRIVEYLNHITVPAVAVIAVVYSRSQDNGLEILSRQIYGEELSQAKINRARDLREKWSIQEFLSWIEANEKNEIEKAAFLLEILEKYGFGIAGGKALTPSLNARIEIANFGTRYPIAVYTQNKGTGIELRFGDFTAVVELAEKFLTICAEVVGDLLNADAIRAANYSKYPKILLRDLTTDQVEKLVANISRDLV